MTKKIDFLDKNTDDFKRFESFANSNVYQIQNTVRYSRIIVWSTDVINTLLNIVRGMGESFFVLYILHVSRTGQETARYQSDKLASMEVESFFFEFGNFIENDSRHDIWIHSPTTDSTVVYDKDNLIYLYGDIGWFQELLGTMKFSKQIDPIYLPVPHTHFYNSELDQQEVEILQYFEWNKSPLHEED